MIITLFFKCWFLKKITCMKEWKWKKPHAIRLKLGELENCVHVAFKVHFFCFHYLKFNWQVIYQSLDYLFMLSNTSNMYYYLLRMLDKVKSLLLANYDEERSLWKSFFVMRSFNGNWLQQLITIPKYLYFGII
jgi:hypothetical protein